MLVRKKGRMPVPKIVDYDKRREELAIALLEVLARDGIDGVSVRSVAAHAGWTRGVISHYFSDRDELLLYAYRLALQREHAAVEQREGDPISMLVALLLRALPIDEESSLDFRIFLGMLGRLADRPGLAASLASDHADYESRVLDSVRAVVDSGAILTPLPVETLAHMLSVYVDGLTVDCALNPDNASRAHLEDEITSFLHSLTSAPTKAGKAVEAEGT